MNSDTFQLDRMDSLSQHYTNLLAEARNRNLSAKAIVFLKRGKSLVQIAQPAGASQKANFGDALGTLKVAMRDDELSKTAVYTDLQAGGENWGEEALRFIDSFWS